MPAWVVLLRELRADSVPKLRAPRSGTSAVAFCRGRLLTAGWDCVVNAWSLDAECSLSASDDAARGHARSPAVTARLAAKIPVGSWVYGMAPLLGCAGAPDSLLMGCTGGLYPDPSVRAQHQGVMSQLPCSALTACSVYAQVLLRIVQLPVVALARAEEVPVDAGAANAEVSLLGHRRGVHALRVRAGLCVSASSDSLRLWDVRWVAAPAALRSVLLPGTEVASAELCVRTQGAPCMLCGDRNGGVHGFDGETGARTLHIATGDGAASSLCMLDEHTLAVGSATRVRVYDLRAEASSYAAQQAKRATSRGVATLHEPHGRQAVNAMCMPPASDDEAGSSGCLLTAGGDGCVMLWDERTWEALQQYVAMDERVPVTSLAADASCVAAGYADGRAAAWRL
jgi:hypothetical protein